jgi:hypothetical protein
MKKKRSEKKRTEVDGVEISSAYLSFNQIKMVIFLCFFPVFHKKSCNQTSALPMYSSSCGHRSLHKAQKVLKNIKRNLFESQHHFIMVSCFLRNLGKMSASIKIDLL